MAVIDIVEYRSLAVDALNRHMPAGLEPHIAIQLLSNGGANTVTPNPFSSDTNFVRVHTDAPCRIEIGMAPTATGSSMRLAGNTTEYFGVRPGMKLAVVTST